MKHVLLLGAGLVSKPLVDYLFDHGFQLTVASRTVSKAEKLAGGHKNGKAEKLLIEDHAHLAGLIKNSDLAISLVPYTHHVTIAKICIEHKKPMVTTSYVSKDMKALDGKAKEAGIIILNEIGLDPGIDHMSAMRIINNVNKKGGKIESFYSYCGGLPAPEANTNPWGYKFSWSPRGVVMAGKNNAQYLKDGKVIEIPSKNLFAHTWELNVPGGGVFDAYPNRDSLSYIDIYGLKGIKTLFRGTLRNKGWCETWYKIGEFGFLNDEKKYDFKNMTYGKFMSTIAGASGDNPKKEVAGKLNIATDSTPVNWFEWLGLFSNDKITLGSGSAMDLLVAKLEEKLKYKPGERDMIVLYHDFLAAYPDHKEKITSTLVDFGIPNGDSAMSRTVALPAAVGTRLILEGKIKARGVHVPVVPEIYNPVLDELEQLKIVCRESVIGQ